MRMEFKVGVLALGIVCCAGYGFAQEQVKVETVNAETVSAEPVSAEKILAEAVSAEKVITEPVSAPVIPAQKAVVKRPLVNLSPEAIAARAEEKKLHDKMMTYVKSGNMEKAQELSSQLRALHAENQKKFAIVQP